MEDNSEAMKGLSVPAVPTQTGDLGDFGVVSTRSPGIPVVPPTSEDETTANTEDTRKTKQKCSLCNCEGEIEPEICSMPLCSTFLCEGCARSIDNPRDEGDIFCDNYCKEHVNIANLRHKAAAPVAKSNFYLKRMTLDSATYKHEFSKLCRAYDSGVETFVFLEKLAISRDSDTCTVEPIHTAVALKGCLGWHAVLGLTLRSGGKNDSGVVL